MSKAKYFDINNDFYDLPFIKIYCLLKAYQCCIKLLNYS